MKDAAAGRWRPRRSAVFVFVTVAIDAMGIGIVIPVMPDLLQELTGLSVGRAAVWGGFLTFSYAAMQFLMSPVLGGLSAALALLLAMGLFRVGLARSG